MFLTDHYLIYCEAIDQCNLIYIGYSNIGDPLIEYIHRGALMWYQERIGK